MLIDLLESSKAIGLCPMGKQSFFAHAQLQTSVDKALSTTKELTQTSNTPIPHRPRIPRIDTN